MERAGTSTSPVKTWRGGCSIGCPGASRANLDR
jgi:hypothetical protein